MTPLKSEGLHLKWCAIDDSPHDTFVRCKFNAFSSAEKPKGNRGPRGAEV